MERSHRDYVDFYNNCNHNQFPFPFPFISHNLLLWGENTNIFYPSAFRLIITLCPQTLNWNPITSFVLFWTSIHRINIKEFISSYNCVSQNANCISNKSVSFILIILGYRVLDNFFDIPINSTFFELKMFLNTFSLNKLISIFYYSRNRYPADNLLESALVRVFTLLLAIFCILGLLCCTIHRFFQWCCAKCKAWNGQKLKLRGKEMINWNFNIYSIQKIY